MREKYRLRAGFQIQRKFVPIIVETVSRLRAEGLRTTDELSERLVEEARPVDAPLHDLIWKYDDHEAARQHRLTLARQIVRSIEVVVIGKDKREHAVRFIHVTEGEEGETEFYLHREVLENRPLAQRIADQAEREVIAWKERYEADCLVYPVVRARVWNVMTAVNKMGRKRKPA